MGRRHERRALRLVVRDLLADAPTGPSRPPVPTWGIARELRRRLGTVSDIDGLVRALARARHPYAAPVAAAARALRDDPLAIERAIDRTHARRAVASARTLGGALGAWVAEGIDLENAWSALAGAGAEAFLDGGTRIGPSHYAAAAAETDVTTRRRRLARALEGGSLAGPFADTSLPVAQLETAARHARLRAMRRRARRDPLGAAPIVALVMQLDAERATLRSIGHGVAQGLPYDAIVAGSALAS